MSWRRWKTADVVWEWTYCEAPRCMKPATVLADADEHGLAGVPVCVGCADLLFEREAALALRPRLELPDPWNQEPRRRAPSPAESSYDRTPEMWLAEQQGVDTSEPDWDVPF